ncbi:hypothetical protein MKJ04_02240 [Pontibacter sp. E15-1]|uniref:hypothetical protein n=1 Tax=Pontibacter sp. E15-1 TaxID=2919918 RepID=UPI001F4FE8D3|nr:hypothetical protein [Pontibacter sp. E15-1]MCJ8163643.1 hypothetical protein [Pontibacter sp. E15-1]
MQKFSFRVIIGLIFSAIGMVTLLLLKQPLTAAIWLSFGNGLILSDLKFTGTDAKGITYTKPIPPARFFTALFLIVMAVVMLALQIYLDFQESAAAAAPAGIN